jgi:hypothetical protein
MRIGLALHDPYEMRHFLNHAAGYRRVGVLDDLVELSQAERPDRGPLALCSANWTADQLEADGARLSH